MDITGPVVLFIIFGGSALILGIALFFAYKREQMKTKERLAAIEKAFGPGTSEGERTALLERLGAFQNGCCPETPRERDIYGGVKILLIGLGLAGGLYVSAGGKAAVWGLFVAFVGLAKVVVGLLRPRPVKEER